MNWTPHIFLFLGLRMRNNNRLHAMDFPPYGMAVYIHITSLSFFLTWPTWRIKELMFMALCVLAS